VFKKTSSCFLRSGKLFSEPMLLMLSSREASQENLHPLSLPNNCWMSKARPPYRKMSLNSFMGKQFRSQFWKLSSLNTISSMMACLSEASQSWMNYFSINVKLSMACT